MMYLKILTTSARIKILSFEKDYEVLRIKKMMNVFVMRQ